MSNMRPAPFFIADSAALDFLNSIAAPRAVEFEWLEDGDDLLDWLVQSGLLDADETTSLRAPSVKADLDRAAEQIRTFREEFRAFVRAASEAGDVPPDHPIIQRLNELMSAGQQSLRLSPDAEGGFECKLIHHVRTADDLLPRIAAACAELVATADFAHVRNCEGPKCTLFFRDVSKNHKRRWCSMEVCGNRAKAAAYRKRG
ncbi:ABATE domain-containing protein [Tateyamaria sp. ANG-S1]|uniref:CGNR zinc finger domain-containing protein n=1 Tax=Tateyamaria sp. ANG-S1 TaxID=1577905 RepID=UPI00057C8F24|nr:ABATE domain-containing protein [Tateyamaria sp. ANG-S1]KIC49553.1 hypothetical protein RA29_07650 [Tateyamaria sp. ANG-S1]